MKIPSGTNIHSTMIPTCAHKMVSSCLFQYLGQNISREYPGAQTGNQTQFVRVAEVKQGAQTGGAQTGVAKAKVVSHFCQVLWCFCWMPHYLFGGFSNHHHIGSFTPGQGQELLMLMSHGRLEDSLHFTSCCFDCLWLNGSRDYV